MWFGEEEKGANEGGLWGMRRVARGRSGLWALGSGFCALRSSFVRMRPVYLTSTAATHAQYLSGAICMLVVERIDRAYSSRPHAMRSPTLRLLNAFKVGFIYGAVLDALKFAG